MTEPQLPPTESTERRRDHRVAHGSPEGRAGEASSDGWNAPASALEEIATELEVPRHGVRRVGERRRRGRRGAGGRGRVPGVPLPGPVRVPAGGGVRAGRERRRRGSREASPATPGIGGLAAKAFAGMDDLSTWERILSFVVAGFALAPRHACAPQGAAHRARARSGTPAPGRSPAWRGPRGRSC